MADKTLMILGLGGVGSHAALLAGRLPGVRTIVGDVRADFAHNFANNVRYDVYFQQDYHRYPEVSGIGLDMTDAGAIGEALDKYRPDVIFNASTLFSWWHIHKLPHELARRLYYSAPEGTGLRPWAPGHGVLLHNLMKTVKKTSPQTRVVNVAGPDYLHEILGKSGLAPDVGVGNAALFEPILTSIVAEKRKVHPAALKIQIIGHHCMCMQIFQEGSCPAEMPFYLKIEEYGKDITQEFDVPNDLWANVPRHMPINNAIHQQFVASNAIQICKSILYDMGWQLHAPGAEGLPGGFPVRVDASGARALVPEGMSREDFEAILYKANYLEGFERTAPDGSATATEQTVSYIEETLGINWKYKVVKPDDFMAAHLEMTEAFARLLARYER